MEQILSVGVPHQLVADLTRQLPAKIHAATSLGEATLLLRNLDFTSVILDLQMAALGLRQLCELMGEAPLTTRFIALCDDPPELDPDMLADLGILFLFRAGGQTLARQIA